MHLIDHATHSSARGKVQPIQLAALPVAVILLCLFARSPRVGLVAAAWMTLLTLAWSRVSPRLLLGLLAVQLPFLVLMCVGLLLLPCSAHAPAAREALGSLGWGSWRLIITRASLAQTLLVTGRAAGSLAAMNFMILSLPAGGVIDLMRQLRAPRLLIDLVTLCHRFIFVLIETAETTRIAQASRGGYASLGRGLRSFATLAANLLVNTLARGRRLHRAMLSRGYEGRLCGAPAAYRWDARLFLIGLFVIGSMLGVWG